MLVFLSVFAYIYLFAAYLLFSARRSGQEVPLFLAFSGSCYKLRCLSGMLDFCLIYVDRFRKVPPCRLPFCLSLVYALTVR